MGQSERDEQRTNEQQPSLGWVLNDFDRFMTERRMLWVLGFACLLAIMNYLNIRSLFLVAIPVGLVAYRVFGRSTYDRVKWSLLMAIPILLWIVIVPGRMWYYG